MLPHGCPLTRIIERFCRNSLFRHTVQGQINLSSGGVPEFATSITVGSSLTKSHSPQASAQRKVGSELAAFGTRLTLPIDRGIPCRINGSPQTF